MAIRKQRPAGTIKPRVGKASGIKIRSSLEDAVIADLKSRGVGYEYEKTRLSYVGKPKTYIPDLKLPNGIFVEVKGWFKSADRSKHLQVQAQHPGLDIRFVFGNSKNKLGGGSKTTYAEWCDKHGFKWADKKVPNEWLQEK